MDENFEAYRAFYYTARTGSLSKAAAELFVTQPAVTHSIKQLEARLGSRLFFRMSKGVRLTSAGEALYPYIEQAYHFIRNGERKLAEIHSLVDGEIRIGAGDTLCKHVLLPRLALFHAAYPGIKIRVTNRTTPETLALLGQGRLDLGIVHMPVTHGNATIRQTRGIQDCFAAGPAFRHLADENKPLAWERLADYPLIMLEGGTSSRAYIDDYARRRGLEVKPEIELGSVDLLVEFAKSGFGIACVVKDFIAEQLAAGELFEIRLKEPIPPRGIGIATMKDIPLTPAADKFVQQFLSGSANEG